MNSTTTSPQQAQDASQKKQSPTERVLALLPSAKSSGRGYVAQCPAHNDRSPSLSVWEDEKGNCGLKCYAGCSHSAICDALGLEKTDLYARNGYRPRKQTSSRKIDLLDLAIDKNIAPALLASWGITDGYTWTDTKGRKHPGVVRVPYYLADGSEHTQIRIRTNLTAKDGSRWEGKGALIPYGLWKLSEAQEAGHCWLVEGESDCWTLWSRKLPALGIPGGTNEKALQASMLDGVPSVYIVSEPDQTGDNFPARIVKRLREIGYAGQCFSVSLQGLYQAKDPNDLLKRLWREERIGEFSALMEAAKDAAQLLKEETRTNDPRSILNELEQAIKDALDTQDANALYTLVHKLVCVEKADQARLKSLIRDGAKHCSGFSLRDFNSLLKDAQAQQARKEAEARVYTSGRPQILLGRQLDEEKIDCFDALHKANARTPSLFVRNRKLSRIVQDENQRPTIEIVGEDALIAHMAKIADFVSYNAERDSYSSQHPTSRLAKTILADSQSWRFPPLIGLTEIPVMRSDGSILDTPGYDEKTHLYYQPTPNLKIPRIPENPSRLEVLRARDFAFSFFAQFSYASQADKANAYGLVLALVMTEIARPALATLLTAATRGEGKGLFTDALSTVISGFPAHTTTLPRDDSELKKELLGRLADGETFISFDNITGTLASRELDSFLTATNWGGRLLGSNTNLAVDRSRVFTLFNGNNVMLGGDLSRRILPIRLASGSSRPWERPITYRYSPLLKHIQEQRGEILAALLTMVRGWHLAGRPLATIRDESCFGPWKRAVGGILKFLEIDGFLGNLDALVEDAAQEDTQWLRFLQTWQEIIQEAVSVKELFTHLEANETLRESLPDKLAEYYEKQNPRSFGYALQKRKDTPYGEDNLKLVKGPRDGHKKVDTWQVVASPISSNPGEEPSQTTCGEDSTKCGEDEDKMNPTRNQTRMSEQASEANGTDLAGKCGLNSSIFTREKENIFFSGVSEKKKEKIIFPCKDTGIDKSSPHLPASGHDPASENVSDMRGRLREEAFSEQSNPQSEKSSPQVGDLSTAGSVDTVREQLLAYGQAHDWPKLPLLSSAIPAGETYWRLYVTRHKLSEIVAALQVTEQMVV